MQKDNEKKQAGASDKLKKEKDAVPKSQVLDTAGGEMPDPERMPSKTKFHSDAGGKKDRK